MILKGYAVDSSDNLYIGKEHSIEVYKEQKLINNIPIQYTGAICRINHFESEKGDVYIKSNMLGYYRIIRNHGEVVYSMPVFDYLVLVTMILAFLSVFAFVFILVLKNLKYWV